MKKLFILMMAISLLCGIFIGSRLWAKSDPYTQLRIFNTVLKTVEDSYVDTIPVDSLIRGAIDGMLGTLGDPHTDYLTKREYKALMESTKGEFEGIGATIGSRNDTITIISPLEGTPAYRAGLLPGDAVLKVNGVPTAGKLVDIVVQEIRGKAGTKVVLSILRKGIDDAFDVEITRAVIKIDAVPYYGMVDKTIGYVQLSTFSRTADVELKTAMDSLFARGAEKLIFDLRLNAGGLLNEAIAVSELFLSRGETVVSAKGRIEPERVYKSAKSYGYGDFPMVTLVDNGSASASEIVAGALQDWDRSLIIGVNTFGKGSVQHLMGPFEDSSAFRITTARWYTPSGRSIDKLPSLQGVIVSDSAAAHDTVPRKIFTTLGPLKRKLSDEGGITPDIVIEPPELSRLETSILSRGLNFDFAVRYTSTHKNMSKEFVVDETMLRDFAVYCMEHNLEFTEQEFNEIKDSLRRRLKQDITLSLWGLKEGYRVRAENDPLVHRAIEMLKDVKTEQELFRFAEP